jgi:hypothetical protein
MAGISGKALASGEASFDSLDLIELAKRLTDAASEWKRIARAKPSA